MQSSGTFIMFQVPAILSGISFTRDNGMSIRFSTNELTAKEKLVVSEYHNKFGYLLFKENSYQDEDIPQSDADTRGKTPSQRLRSVLYVYWTNTGSNGDFDVFYRNKMENLINMVKEKIL